MNKFVLFWILCIVLPVISADENIVITAENHLSLRSVQQIDFATIGEFTSGWFALSDDGERIMVQDAQHTLFEIDGDQVTPLSTRPDFVTGTFIGQDWVGVYLYNTQIRLVERINGQEQVLDLPSERDVVDYPADVWGTDEFIYLEVQSNGMDGKPYVLQVNRQNDAVQRIDYIPALDDTAVVRIGRVPAPYVVTSSLVGEVKLWDWARGQYLKVVSNLVGEPSVFGNINASATHLVWRDNANENLYLLDLDHQTNQRIDELNGDYAQWYFLSQQADVIIAVNLGFRPNVVVWDVKTGSRTELGNYRQCERPQPDMARLSSDGTTLVIGCDSGLDIWKIEEK